MPTHHRTKIAFPFIMFIAFLAGGLLATLPTRSFADSAGYALYFDGVNDYVLLNQTNLIMHSDWRNEKTIHLWVRPMGNSKVCQFPVPGWCDNIFGDRPRWWGISRGVINGQDGIWIWNNSETLRIDYTIGEWVNIALVHSGGMLRAYKNGVEVGSVPSGTTLQPPAQPVLQLGGVINNEERVWTFEGEMDEVRIWNRGLSASEISGSMYNSLNGGEPDLAAYYKMSDGSGLSLTDDSGHGWTGTLLDGGGIVPPNGAPPLWVISGAFDNVQITNTPTPTPGSATDTPTPADTDTPTPIPPSDTPTSADTDTPTPIPPSDTPTPADTDTPTPIPPSDTPTPADTDTPTPIPPSDTPTSADTDTPTSIPPSDTPTLADTDTPTPVLPSNTPTATTMDTPFWHYPYNLFLTLVFN